MLRSQGRKSLQCDKCDTIFDDRPRHPRNIPRDMAAKQGWTNHGELDLCDECSQTYEVSKWGILPRDVIEARLSEEAVERGKEPDYNDPEALDRARNRAKFGVPVVVDSEEGGTP